MSMLNIVGWKPQELRLTNKDKGISGCSGSFGKYRGPINSNDYTKTRASFITEKVTKNVNLDMPNVFKDNEVINNEKDS